MSNMDGPDAPYPGMASAFEKYTGQSWTDIEWRSEAIVWAAAWKAASARHEEDKTRLDSRTIALSTRDEFGELCTTRYCDIDLRAAIDAARSKE